MWICNSVFAQQQTSLLFLGVDQLCSLWKRNRRGWCHGQSAGSVSPCQQQTKIQRRKGRKADVAGIVGAIWGQSCGNDFYFCFFNIFFVHSDKNVGMVLLTIFVELILQALCGTVVTSKHSESKGEFILLLHFICRAWWWGWLSWQSRQFTAYDRVWLAWGDHVRLTGWWNPIPNLFSFVLKTVTDMVVIGSDSNDVVCQHSSAKTLRFTQWWVRRQHAQLFPHPCTPYPAYKCTVTHCSSSCSLTSGISVMEFVMSWLLL